MKLYLLTFLTVVFTFSCGKQVYVEPAAIPVFHIEGRFDVYADSGCWIWEFKEGGRLYTWKDGDVNTCGLYFFSNHTDTLVTASVLSGIHRGALWLKGDTYYHETGKDTLIMKQLR